MKKLLKEDTFRFETLDQNKQEKIFDIFKSSYEASVGTSWTKDKFYGRAKNWLFFGDDNGFVTVRPQQSGLYKLTGVAGNLKSILKGLEELQQLNVPVWGMVSKDIQTMANKKGLKTPPGFLVKIMLGFIPKSTFGGVDFDINSDGSVTMKYEDVGDAKKYFVGNDLYFKQIKKDLYPKVKEKISDLPLLARKSIELFLNESKEEIDMNEDITSGSVIVYHRTGSKGDSPVEGISADGYRVGRGAAYGVGVYTTYDLNSQLKNNMRSTYGHIIIESKVLSLDKFLIFDYDIAKKIYGNKNYTLSRQLRIILGSEYKKYISDKKEINELITLLGFGNQKLTKPKMTSTPKKVNNNIENIKNLEKKLNDGIEFTSTIANIFYSNFPEIVKKLRGIIFTGQSDGKVLVSYDRKNVEPLRYTTDEGESWKNIINKNIYNRLKNYEIDKDLSYEHHLNNLNTNMLDVDDVNYITNNLNFYIDHLTPFSVGVLLSYSMKPKKLFNKLGKKGIEFIEKFEFDDLRSIIFGRRTRSTHRFINFILSKNEILKKLDLKKHIHILIDYYTDLENLFKILGIKPDEFFINLDNHTLEILLFYPSFLYYLKSNYHIIEEFNPDFTNKLILRIISYNFNDKDKFINYVISNDKIINKLNSDTINEIIENSKNSDKVKEIISNRKQVQENINRIKILLT